jgi:hypothetical protein
MRGYAAIVGVFRQKREVLPDRATLGSKIPKTPSLRRTSPFYSTKFDRSVANPWSALGKQNALQLWIDRRNLYIGPRTSGNACRGRANVVRSSQELD